MNAPEVAAHLADRLVEASIEYGIGGALALGVWGAPRATADVDISLFVDLSEFDSVAESFERAGVIFDRRGAPRDIERIGMFHGRLGRTKVDVFMSAHPHMDAMKERRRRMELDGKALWFISPEDLCLMKLIYGRAKDVTDLERLFAVRPDLDVSYVRSWLVRMVPPTDDRVSVLGDLERRFVRT